MSNTRTDPHIKLAADNIRILSAEAVQKAKSGHPGMPMGCADFGFVLWYKYMRHNPFNPKWIGRDYFVLSAGHGSMLLYSLLYLFEYGLTLDDIKNFRQWESVTPGHPEYGLTDGVEVTTGPLASGFATAVGIAVEAKNFIARASLDKTKLFESQKIYAILGDGCIMEGASHEAASLAGHLKLDNLVCFYDSNSITIEGPTSLAFSEDVGKRFEAYGWRVIHLDDANNISKIEETMDSAVISDGRPTLIIGKTKIGYGAPRKEGKSSAHGEPLGAEELSETKKHFNFPETPFFIYPEVANMCKERVEELKSSASAWNKDFNRFVESKTESAELISQLLHKPLPENLLSEFLEVVSKDKPAATRASSGAILQKAAQLIPALAGGSADLTPSTKTEIKNDSDFSSENRTGRNFHFGVREFCMGLNLNGMALYGTSIPYGATFLVFADYMKPAIKLAALQKLHVIYVFTHDSVYVGEDGPTHQPVEQLAMLRAVPDLTTIRPADANETAHAWNAALAVNGPVALILTRQNVSPIPSKLTDKIQLNKGAYVLDDDNNPELLIIGTGSEVGLSLEAAKQLRKDGINTRVVSMPSRELFLMQTKEYQNKVLPPDITQRVSIEMGTTFGWREFVGNEGLCIGIDHFGHSAPAQTISEKYGFTPQKIVEKIRKHFRNSPKK